MEVTAPEAAEILSTSHPTIFRRVQDGTLYARREGVKKEIYIDIDTLRAFAKEYGYRFDEALATQYAK